MSYLTLRRHVPRGLLPWTDRLADTVEEALAAATARRIPLPDAVAGKRVILAGASVARSWRLHRVFPDVRALELGRFDKTPIVEEAIAMRPDAIVIKECAAYFPGAEGDRGLVQGWIDRIRGRGIRPGLATVVPVTRRHAGTRPGRAEAIRDFNDWLRALAAAGSVPVLDLEAALRTSAADRHLDERLHAGDGLHLSRRTYREVLDSLIPPFLLRLFEDR